MFSDKVVQDVWIRTTIPLDGFDPNIIASDCCGAVIVLSEYGNVDSPYGWEIDHIFPVSSGGTDIDDNLRAMHWENNRSKGNDFPIYKVSVISDGSKNVHCDKQMKVNDAIVTCLQRIYNFEI